MSRAYRIIKHLFLPSTWVHFVRLFDSTIHDQLEARLLIHRGGKVTIDSSASFRNPQNISMGKGAFVNFMCSVWAGPRSKVILGEDAIMGPYVHINCTNHVFTRRDLPILSQGYNEADIEIGRGVWIGAHCVVLAGARIGEGAIIGANSVVRGEIPPFTVAVGSPARVIKTRP